jgi:hypothetical protein
METNYQDLTLPTTIPIPRNLSLLDSNEITGRITNLSQPIPGPEVAINPGLQAVASRSVAFLTYKHLEEFHLKRIAFDEDGHPRSPAIIRNHRSILKSWPAILTSDDFKIEGKDFAFHFGPVKFVEDSLLIGAELGLRFNECLGGYLTALADKGYSKHTLDDRKSILRAVRESWLDLVKTNGLPDNFADALRFLIRSSGHTVAYIGRQTRMTSQLYYWLRGHLPHRLSLPKVERLEDFFHIPRGHLSSKLPDAAWQRKAGRRTGTTKWREHLKLVHQSRYYLASFPPCVEAEWQRIYRAYTDKIWARTQKLRLNSEWRIRKNLGTSPTAEYKKLHLRGFFGYLCLPETGEDSWQKGKGFSQDALTIALIGDAELVFDYINFCKGRTLSQSYNTATNTFLAFCAQVLRPETGYLWQQPEFGMRLPRAISKDEWRDWCADNLEKILGIRKDINNSKNSSFALTRDPFEAVRDIIENNQHPITVLMELAKTMESLIPLLKRGSPYRLALHMRNLTLVKLATANPLRTENFAMMRFIPKNPDDLIDPNRLYVQTEPDSNLYQRPDGSFWLRFTTGEMKYGVVDVPLPPSVCGTLKEYLFNHRPVLNRGVKRELNKLRSINGLVPLTADEESAIDHCHFLFRPDGAFGQMKLDTLKAYRGTEQISNHSLRDVVMTVTQRLIPDCKGFSLHAFRHIVASEYIKNYPNGYAVAAAALNNTEEMVRKHYAWVRPCDRIKPWNEHFEKMQEAVNKGEIAA